MPTLHVLVKSLVSNLDQMEAAANEVHNGKGILFIVKNYLGYDEFEMGADMIDLIRDYARNDDAVVEDLLLQLEEEVAGTMIVETVGSLAENGASLEECKLFKRSVNNVTASMASRQVVLFLQLATYF